MENSNFQMHANCDRPRAVLDRRLGVMALIACLTLAAGCRHAADSWALRFEPSSGLVAELNDVAFEDGLTVEAWVTGRMLMSLEFRVLELRGDTGFNRTYPNTFVILNHGAILFRGLWGPHSNLVNTGPLLDPAGTGWHHVACTYDHSEQRIFVDGVLVAQGPATGDLAKQTRATIGGGSPGMILSEVRVWNRARAGEEIARDKNRRLSGAELGLVAYWPLNEGTGQVAHDRTANHRDAKFPAGNYDPPTWVVGPPLK